MALSKKTVTQFHTLGHAFCNGDVLIIECTDKKTKKKVPIVCVVLKKPDTKDHRFFIVPAALMLDERAVKRYAPPELSCAQCRTKQQKYVN